MLTNKEIMNLWIKSKPACLGYGVPREAIIAFAQTVEAMAVSRARKLDREARDLAYAFDNGRQRH